MPELSGTRRQEIFLGNTLGFPLEFQRIKLPNLEQFLLGKMGKRIKFTGAKRKRQLKEARSSKGSKGKRKLRHQKSLIIRKPQQKPEESTLEAMEVVDEGLIAEEIPKVLLNFREFDKRFFNYLLSSGKFSLLLERCTSFLVRVTLHRQPL